MTFGDRLRFRCDKEDDVYQKYKYGKLLKFFLTKGLSDTSLSLEEDNPFYGMTAEDIWKQLIEPFKEKKKEAILE